jgi:hypothetical protein
MANGREGLRPEQVAFYWGPATTAAIALIPTADLKAGDTVFDIDKKQMQGWIGTQWSPMGGAATDTVLPATGTAVGQTFFKTGGADGLYVWNGTAWRNLYYADWAPGV